MKRILVLTEVARRRYSGTQFKKTGTSLNPGVEMEDFYKFCELIGFKEVWDFESRWAGADVVAD